MSNMYTVLDVLAGVSVSTPDEWRLARDLDLSLWYPLPTGTVLNADDIHWYTPGKCWVNTMTPGRVICADGQYDHGYYRRKFTISPSEDREAALARKYVGYTAHGLRLELETLKGVIDKITKERDEAVFARDQARIALTDYATHERSRAEELTSMIKERDEVRKELDTVRRANQFADRNYNKIFDDLNVLRKERDDAVNELDATRNARSEARAVRDAALDDRDAARQGWALAIRDRDTAIRDRDIAWAEAVRGKDSAAIVNHEVANLTKERDEARVQRDSAILECDKAIAERDSVVAISQVARSDRDRAIKSLSEVSNDRDALRLENKSLHAALSSFNEFAVEIHAERQTADAIEARDYARRRSDEYSAALSQTIKERDSALRRVEELLVSIRQTVKERDDARDNLNSCIAGLWNAPIWKHHPVLNEELLRHMPNDLPPEHLYDGDM